VTAFGRGQHGQALRSQELGRLQCRPSLAGPYRDHLRKCRVKQPAVAVQQLPRQGTRARLSGPFEPARPLPDQIRREERPAAARRAVRLLFIRTAGLAAGQRWQPGTLRRCTADPGRRWPPNAADHPRPALRPRFGRGPGLDIQAATAALNLRSTRLARRGQHKDPDDQAANAGPRQLRPP